MVKPGLKLDHKGNICYNNSMNPRPKNPEFSRGAEIADQTELSYLFDQAKAQICAQGEHRPLRPDVQRAPDGLPILTGLDIDNESTDAHVVQMATRSIIHLLPRTAANLEIGSNAMVDLLYVPEHYYEDIEPSESGIAKKLVHIPPQVNIIVPKNQLSVYGEDSITLHKRRIGSVEVIQVSRDKLLKHQYHNRLKISSGGRQGDADFEAQFECVEDDFNALTKQETVDLIAVIHSVPLTRG